MTVRDNPPLSPVPPGTGAKKEPPLMIYVDTRPKYWGCTLNLSAKSKKNWKSAQLSTWEHRPSETIRKELERKLERGSTTERLLRLDDLSEEDRKFVEEKVEERNCLESESALYEWHLSLIRKRQKPNGRFSEPSHQIDLILERSVKPMPQASPKVGEDRQEHPKTPPVGMNSTLQEEEDLYARERWASYQDRHFQGQDPYPAMFHGQRPKPMRQGGEASDDYMQEYFTGHGHFPYGGENIADINRQSRNMPPGPQPEDRSHRVAGGIPYPLYNVKQTGVGDSHDINHQFHHAGMPATNIPYNELYGTPVVNIVPPYAQHYPAQPSMPKHEKIHLQEPVLRQQDSQPFRSAPQGGEHMRRPTREDLLYEQVYQNTHGGVHQKLGNRFRYVDESHQPVFSEGDEESYSSEGDMDHIVLASTDENVSVRSAVAPSTLGEEVPLKPKARGSRQSHERRRRKHRDHHGGEEVRYKEKRPHSGQAWSNTATMGAREKKKGRRYHPSGSISEGSSFVVVADTPQTQSGRMPNSPPPTPRSGNEPVANKGKSSSSRKREPGSDDKQREKRESVNKKAASGETGKEIKPVVMQDRGREVEELLRKLHEVTLQGKDQQIRDLQEQLQKLEDAKSAGETHRQIDEEDMIRRGNRRVKVDSELRGGLGSPPIRQKQYRREDMPGGRYANEDALTDEDEDEGYSYRDVPFYPYHPGRDDMPRNYNKSRRASHGRGGNIPREAPFLANTGRAAAPPIVELGPEPARELPRRRRATGAGGPGLNGYSGAGAGAGAAAWEAPGDNWTANPRMDPRQHHQQQQQQQQQRQGYYAVPPNVAAPPPPLQRNTRTREHFVVEDADADDYEDEDDGYMTQGGGRRGRGGGRRTQYVESYYR